MPQQEPLLAFSSEEDEEEVPESIYGGFVEAAEELDELSEQQLENYRVVWESTGHNHSTSYSIDGTDTKFGEITIEIVGGRGGEYFLFPKKETHPG